MRKMALGLCAEVLFSGLRRITNAAPWRDGTSMKLPAGFYAYMTTSMADRSDAATWGSRQPPPPHVHACDQGDRDIMIAFTSFTSGSDARTDVYKHFVELRTATLAVATTLPAIPEALRGIPTVHVARKTLTMGAS
jgi:hypothetical protein